MKMDSSLSQSARGASLEVRNLTKTFRSGGQLFGKAEVFTAVDRASFHVAAGKTTGLIGESGSGKTTLARMIIGLTQPDSGEILVDGSDIRENRRNRAEFARLVQIVFQDPTSSLNPRWTVGDLIAEGIRTHNLVPAGQVMARVRALAAECGIDPDALDRFPHEFSGGQRQRIAIARALAVEPRILLLDEPVSALDVSVQAQILVLLKKLQDEYNLTYLLIAHDLAVVERFCDQIIVMRHGEIVEIGNPHDVHNNPQHPYTRMLIEAHPVPDPHQRIRR